MMYDFPPSTLYQALFDATIGVVPGAPYWKYDGQFMWLPMPQSGYERFTNDKKASHKKRKTRTQKIT